jgi:hypothetical protein
MKQKLEDLKLRLRHDRKVWAGAGLVFFVLILTVFSGGEKPKKKRVGQEQENASNISLSRDEAFNDLFKRFNNDMEVLTRESRENAARVEQLEQARIAAEEKQTGVTAAIVERMEEMSRRMEQIESQPAPEPVGGGMGAAAPSDPSAIELPSSESSGSEKFGFEEATVPPPPAPPQIQKVSVISAGDSVSVELLTGVAAPTDGTPYPTVFRVLGPIVGPDGSALDVGEARLIAAAQGSETDGRVLYRLTDLSIRHKDGRRSVVKVDGWVVGEDGVRGMRGQVIDKLGQVIAATAGVSFAAALGDRVTDRTGSLPLNQVTFDRRGRPILQDQGLTVTGNDVDIGIASAMTDASNRLGELLLEKYSKLIPVVEVKSGRKVAAVFSSSSEVELLEQENNESIYQASASAVD